MRILSIVFQIVIVGLILGAFFYFLVAPLWLTYASRSFVKEVTATMDLTKDLTTLRTICRRAPAASNESSPLAVQVRFINATEYNTEVVCSLIESTPVRLTSERLPMFVQKTPGKSGLYFNLQRPQNSSISLQILRSQQPVSIIAGVVDLVALTFADPTQNPSAVCVGFGYQCCQAQTQRGTGKLITQGVIDCPSSCAEKCKNIPYLSSFSADPFPDERREIVMTDQEVQVTFSYTIESPDTKIKEVEIDYGDGNSDVSVESVGIFSHTYRCTSACQMTVRLRAEDVSGQGTVENEQSTLYIVHR